MLKVTPETGPIQKISYQDEVYAIIIRASLPFKGYNFVSEASDSLQVGVNHYEKGSVAKPHFHLPLERALTDTLELLHIDSGQCQLDLFNLDKQPIYRTTLENGDTVVLLRGGHALIMTDRTRIVEVKQGPYLGPAKDKVFFDIEGGYGPAKT